MGGPAGGEPHRGTRPGAMTGRLGVAVARSDDDGPARLGADDVLPSRRHWRCVVRWHRFVDFPDPNPETRGLEQQGYRACILCSKEKDAREYLPRRGLIRP